MVPEARPVVSLMLEHTMMHWAAVPFQANLVWHEQSVVLPETSPVE